MIPLKKRKRKNIKYKKSVIYARKGNSTDDDDKKPHKVREHCHYTGKYRDAASQYL